jgi:predicted nucleic acid-binding protein
VTVLYLDSSAAVRAIEGDDKTLNTIAQANGLVASRLTELEVQRVLFRFEVTGELEEHALNRLRHRASELLQQVELYGLDENLGRALERFPIEPVRTLDAIHLATLARLGRTLPKLAMFTYDARMHANAKKMGFKAFPPAFPKRRHSVPHSA